MTLLRFLAIASGLFLLLLTAKGQLTQSSSGVSQALSEHMSLADTAAVDTTGSTLVIPNVFTPNGDGIHDHFEVETDGTTVYDFSIFTRTGTKVYHSSSPRIFWDGTNSSGLDLKEGVYYYVIEEEKGASTPYSNAGFIYLFR